GFPVFGHAVRTAQRQTIAVTLFFIVPHWFPVATVAQVSNNIQSHEKLYTPWVGQHQRAPGAVRTSREYRRCRSVTSGLSWRSCCPGCRLAIPSSTTTRLGPTPTSNPSA